MQDRLFLALYRSNDPKVRAAAMDKLNKAHHQAYGDAPTKDDELHRPGVARLFCFILLVPGGKS